MTRLVLVGGGRMGTAILHLTRDSTHRVVAVVQRSTGEGEDIPRFTDLQAALDTAPGSVVLDFSSSENAAQRIALVGAGGHSLVQGTTGLDDAAHRALADISRTVPVVEAPNTSPGLALLREALTRILSQAPSWDVAITDRHHRQKRDAPSGTAKLLAQTVVEITGTDPQVSSHRQGGVVGEHSVVLSGLEEELVLTHRALTRSVFARGALLAADFCTQAAPGHYGMSDVLQKG